MLMMMTVNHDDDDDADDGNYDGNVDYVDNDDDDDDDDCDVDDADYERIFHAKSLCWLQSLDRLVIFWRLSNVSAWSLMSDVCKNGLSNYAHPVDSSVEGGREFEGSSYQEKNDPESAATPHHKYLSVFGGC